MYSRALLISGGQIEREHALGEITEQDYIIAIDRGLNFLDANQIEPHYIVGDFDSVSDEVIERYRKNGRTPIREFQPEKDYSDTEIAVRHAIEMGYQQIDILGATGDRIDHVLANVQVLSIPYKQGISARIIDKKNRISYLEKCVEFKRSELYGQYFSLFAIGGCVEGLTIEGAKYPLKDHRLEPYDSLSVSNECEDEVVRISYREGLLLLIESRE